MARRGWSSAALVIVVAMVVACGRPKGAAPDVPVAVVSPSPVATVAPSPEKSVVPAGDAVPVASAGAPVMPVEKELWEISVDGREGASVRDVCTAWKNELIAGVLRMQKAGQGLEGYDEKNVTCTEMPAPRLEGALPDGWSIPTAVTLGFFDGVAVKEDRYLMLRRKDGRIVGGPLYSTANDIGDSGRPSAWRIAVLPSNGTKLLVLASVTVEIPTSAYRPDGTPDPSADWNAEHRARVCHLTPSRVKCDEPRMTLFSKRPLTAAQKSTHGTTLKPDLPALLPTGHLNPAED